MYTFLNKKINNQYCHCEPVRAWQSHQIASHPFAMTEQRGRSMVEMLGVLAIVGVLSIAVVSGYTTAMKKHRANELLNEASKRAVVLAMKIAAGQPINNDSLSEFDSNTVGSASFTGADEPAGESVFTISLNGASELCDQLKTLGNDSIMAFDENCTQITFNKDLSKNPTSYTASSSNNTSGGNSSGNQGNEQGGGEQAETTPTCAPDGDSCTTSADCCNNNCNSSGYCGTDGCTPNGDNPPLTKNQCCSNRLDAEVYECVSCLGEGNLGCTPGALDEGCCPGYHCNAYDRCKIKPSCIPEGYSTNEWKDVDCCEGLFKNPSDDNICGTCISSGPAESADMCCDEWDDVHKECFVR